MENGEAMAVWGNRAENSTAETRAEDCDDAWAFYTTPTTPSSMEDSGDTDSWFGSDGSDGLWLGMDVPSTDEWTPDESYDFSRAAEIAAEESSSPDSVSLCAEQLTDTDSTCSPSDSGSELNPAPCRRTAQATNGELKPIRMTVLAEHRAGDVCYAHVPGTGQRVASRVPPGSSPGDKFLVMYRPTQVANVGDLRKQSRIVELATQKARTTMDPLTVEEALALLREPTWAGGQVPTRPLRLQDPIESFLFRELRTHKRRQKKEVGSIDRWKNTGGKRAVVTLDIPPALRRDGSNVLVVRHGRVLRADGGVAQYRQWTFGTLQRFSQPERETLQEPKGADHSILYQIFVQPGQGGADTPVPLSTTPEPLPPRPSEIDFTLLEPSAARRTFEEHRWNGDSQEQLLGDDLPTPKKKRFAALYASVAVVAILGTLNYVYTAGTTESDSEALDQVTCSGTSENLLHWDASSYLNCTQRLGHQCDLVCEPGYWSSGKVSCAKGNPAWEGDAACTKCAPGTFSAEGTECKPCSPCSGITSAACTDTADTRCVSWEGHLDSPPTNQTQPWHLPQFAAVWSDTSTTFAFGGKGSATPPSDQAHYENEACTTLTSPMSNELWVRESSQHWRRLGGDVARSYNPASSTILGTAGWPSPRSSAASWSIPSEISARNVLQGLSAVLFSGSFLAPCAETSAVGVRSLLNPSDLWVYQRPDKHRASGGWMLIGGQQSWAEPPLGNDITELFLQGQLTDMPTVGGDLTHSITAPAPAWPLGRHDAHTWVVGGSLLLFSGAIDWYQRAGGGETAKRACLLNDYWLLHIDKDTITWENGGGLTKGTTTTPRPRQPGPRVFGATWSSANPTSGADVAWLFGGIGSTYCEGDGVWGSAVAAPADRLLDQTGASADCALHTMCDLWSYTPPSARSIGGAESPWTLVWACALDMELLNRHSEELGMPLSIPAQVSDMALEAVLATTWVDSDQNLWLFGGAECKEVPDSRHSCASVLKDELNPRPAASSLTQGRRQLAEIWNTLPPAAPAAVDQAAAATGTPFVNPSWQDSYDASQSYIPSGPSGPSPPVGPGTYYPSVPSGPVVPRTYYPPPPPPPTNPGYIPPVAPPALPMGETTVIPCTDELWRFDTVAMQWSSFNAVQGDSSMAKSGDSAVAREQQWPAGECGASAIPHTPTEAGPSATELVGGWNFRAFATCGSDTHSTGAACSSNSWLLGPEQP